jgi:hypothetical protein
VKSEARIEVATWRDTANNSAIRVRVEDGPSGELLVDMEFTPAEWWALINGSTHKGPSQRTSHPERLGRTLAVRSAQVPREALSTYGKAAEAEARAWADGARLPDEQASVQQTNSGWMAVFRSWHA